MSQGKKYYWDLSAWLGRNKNDKALEVCPFKDLGFTLNGQFQGFLPKLKDHILGRLIPGSKADDRGVEFMPAQCNALHFINNCIYRHKVLRVNYTTYDLHRAQDSLNPCMHADVMVLSHEDIENPHPYWYARIIRIFHVDIWYVGLEMRAPAPKHIDFLRARWFACNRNLKAGWAVCRLPCIGFYPHDEPEGFGFIDPEQVIRGMHLIPAFHFGCTTALLPPSIARCTSDNNEDWDWDYVNM